MPIYIKYNLKPLQYGVSGAMIFQVEGNQGFLVAVQLGLKEAPNIESLASIKQSRVNSQGNIVSSTGITESIKAKLHTFSNNRMSIEEFKTYFDVVKIVELQSKGFSSIPDFPENIEQALQIKDINKLDSLLLGILTKQDPHVPSNWKQTITNQDEINRFLSRTAKKPSPEEFSDFSSQNSAILNVSALSTNNESAPEGRQPDAQELLAKNGQLQQENVQLKTQHRQLEEQNKTCNAITARKNQEIGEKNKEIQRLNNLLQPENAPYAMEQQRSPTQFFAQPIDDQSRIITYIRYDIKPLQYNRDYPLIFQCEKNQAFLVAGCTDTKSGVTINNLAKMTIAGIDSRSGNIIPSKGILSIIKQKFQKPPYLQGITDKMMRDLFAVVETAALQAKGFTSVPLFPEGVKHTLLIKDISALDSFLTKQNINLSVSKKTITNPVEIACFFPNTAKTQQSSDPQRPVAPLEKMQENSNLFSANFPQNVQNLQATNKRLEEENLQLNNDNQILELEGASAVVLWDLQDKEIDNKNKEIQNLSDLLAEKNAMHVNKRQRSDGQSDDQLIKWIEDFLGDTNTGLFESEIPEQSVELSNDSTDPNAFLNLEGNLFSGEMYGNKQLRPLTQHFAQPVSGQPVNNPSHTSDPNIPQPWSKNSPG